MHIKSIHIQNLLSFVDAEFQFDQFNVIVGTNNSGKTNLVRILKLLFDSDSLDNFRLENKIKFDNNKNSRISLRLEFTDKEIKLLLRTIFGRDVTETNFSSIVKNLHVILNWNDVINDESTPNFVMYSFENGFTIIEGRGKQIVFDTESTLGSTSNIVQLTESIKSFSMDQILDKIPDLYNMSEDSQIGQEPALLEALIQGKSITSYFVTKGFKKWTYLALEIRYNYQNPTRTASEVVDYMKFRKKATITISLPHLLNRIIRYNLTFIEEIRPTIDTLTRDLFSLKSKQEPVYNLLKDEFSGIFNGITMRVDEIVDEHSNSSFKILLSENGREFFLEESASGHYALIHILHTILNRPNQILVMDEPEIHFHPIKINHLSQKLAELAVSKNNQIIIISHSPQFVSYKLLDNSNPYSLTYMNKINGESVIQSTPKNFQTTLKSHLFNPEIFFSKGTLIGEGAGDEFALKAISDHFGGLFEKYNITLMQMWGVDNIFPNIEIHNAFKIPFVAMVDKEYDKNMAGVIQLSIDLEDEYKKLGWQGSGKLKEDAYSFMRNLLQQQDGLSKLKTTGIWESFESIIEKCDGDIPQ